MPICCFFTLNGKTISTLHCSGYGTVGAFSGHGHGRENPVEVATPNVGPIPPGTYYIVDRQSGGVMGWAYDAAGEYFGLTTDRSKWFALWHPETGDTTMVQGVRRGQFRLHAEGPSALSEGCIAVVNPAEFELLQRHIRKYRPLIAVPRSTLMAYGTVEVR
ncbi:DUF2778 domain-containing protein (plasmid) [Caballeronia sp. NK8]|uniref:DUF2778 domain-containing protein n=1 Tax=Caballeronia sp. NK8 TaxID=140098 RepID=UPI001BB64725|nr:DUF2778 domain-containing protein [Caballeronia sp. NK8]BCQ28069.1 DUF2778 domain-containing protein [Caballeronia sp. NK8]